MFQNHVLYRFFLVFVVALETFIAFPSSKCLHMDPTTGLVRCLLTTILGIGVVCVIVWYFSFLCFYRGARHGLKLNGKLQRLEQQEKTLVGSTNSCAERPHRGQAAGDVQCEIAQTDRETDTEPVSQTKRKRKKQKRRLDTGENETEYAMENGAHVQSKKGKRRQDNVFSKSNGLEPVQNETVFDIHNSVNDIERDTLKDDSGRKKKKKKKEREINDSDNDQSVELEGLEKESKKVKKKKKKKEYE